MTTPDHSALGDAAEADVAEQLRPVDDIDDDVSLDAERVSVDRDWEASEADLIEQATAVPADEESAR
ncbi:MAG: hypothetical protein AB7G47_03840 [Mycolicibacterium sp.]|uniref:hypothetical protein n=1 Tax=Mycolicibacterium sp. TaxID=2320850 RepID=UPI003D0AF731